MQLLGPLIAGNAKLFMLAGLSPNPNHYLETVSTLRTATKAQGIQVKFATHLTAIAAC